MKSYYDFIETINKKREELSKEINTYDLNDYAEYEYMKIFEEQLCRLTEIQEYFMNSEIWVEFAGLDSLKLYVEALNNCYVSMEAYLKSVLPVDGGELMGITNKEFDEVETTRYSLYKLREAWSLFLEFCESGEI